ncbi:hypothetical protein [Spirosoma endbachense]|uniref:Uncharacterized protein n=1 Tax=Spirosoma endbachense TaxID=2666025 RepID=A0A6P1VV18_9BACT|nr:hypothetical protein [Spirosoma endbachense]QHV96268.1 hypothetical protein GJR95_15145 [Spirosoma endbachense]
MNILAERLTKAFDALGLSAHKFAAKHGTERVNRKSVFNLVDEDTRPSFDQVVKVCELEPTISAEYLLRGIGNPIKPDYAIDNTDPCADLIDHIQKQIQDNTSLLANRATPISPDPKE